MGFSVRSSEKCHSSLTSKSFSWNKKSLEILFIFIMFTSRLSFLILAKSLLETINFFLKAIHSHCIIVQTVTYDTHYFIFVHVIYYEWVQKSLQVNQIKWLDLILWRKYIIFGKNRKSNALICAKVVFSHLKLVRLHFRPKTHPQFSLKFTAICTHCWYPILKSNFRIESIFFTSIFVYHTHTKDFYQTGCQHTYFILHIIYDTFQETL